MNTEWKPIASAPKDGTRVLLWNEKFTAPCSGQFYGFDNWKMDSDIPPFAFQPTHWMPLPPAPTSHPIPTGATGEDTDSFEDPSALAAVADALAEDASNDNAQFAAAYLYRQAKAIIDAPAAGDALDAQALEDLQRLLEYAQTSDDCQYGTLSTGLVRDLTAKALATLAAAGDALKFLADTEGAIESLMLEGRNTLYRVWWPAVGELQTEWFASPQEAVDAAIAQQSQRKEA